MKFILSYWDENASAGVTKAPYIKNTILSEQKNGRGTRVPLPDNAEALDLEVKSEHNLDQAATRIVRG
jgi:hypothetical protein